MLFEQIQYQVKENLAYITINRPEKLNALNMQTLAEIDKARTTAQEDPAIRGIILSGVGEKAFAAGADIAEFAGFSAKQGTALAASGHQIMDAIAMCPKPVVAVIHGFALGGGCELAMACHMRIAAENAKFGQPEVKLGLVPGYGGTQRLVQLVGKGKAIELLMSAEMISAQQALQLGLVNHVVPANEAMQTAEQLLGKIAKNGPNAVAHIVRLVNDNFDKTTNGFTNEINTFGQIFTTPEFVEGTTAFLEKRKPSFS